MRKIDMIVIHCSATEAGKDYGVDEVREWHKSRGFNDIGYHYLIRIDGTVEKGRNITVTGAHAKGYNRRSIGICYVGGLKDSKPYDTRTPEQIKSMNIIVKNLKDCFNIKTVVGHRDLSVDLNGDGVVTKDEWMKSCPCFEVKKEYL
jgi:N-acetyl-anhydromuramyl-L-alanine amidase AmpD